MSSFKHLRTPAIVCMLLLSACNSPDEGHVTSKQQALTAQEERVLAFEQVSDWQVWSGSGTLGQGSPHSEGSQSLAVSGLGYAGIRNTTPIAKDSHPAPEVVGYDVLIPTNQVNPSWSGDTQLMINAPSAGIHSQYLGYRSFAGLPKGEFTRVEFPLPDWIRQALNAANYTDLRFVIALNVPPGSATHYLDRFILGPDPGSSECTPVDDGNPCTADDCNPATGQTTHVPLAPGALCSDNNACNGVEACDGAGTCAPGEAPLVDDGNACTSDSCDPETGVSNIPVSAGVACGDGNTCNGDELCDGAGTCQAGSGPALDDSNPCTADACDPSGGVTHTPVSAGVACGDDNACNGAETCDGAGACQAGTPVETDDGNTCTVGSCDPQTGVVTQDPAPADSPCGDGDLCNGSESCDGAGSCEAGAPLNPDDGNACTIDSCDPVFGIENDAASQGLSCADGDVCNGAEACDGLGSCEAGAPLVVDDGNVCTADSCDPLLGAQYAPTSPGTACGDSNQCNGDELCDGNGSCQAGTPLDPDDGNVCTADSCDSEIGAVNNPEPAGTSCDDGDVCSGLEVCDGSGICEGGSPLEIDDENPCTVDTCDPITGPSHVPVPAGVGCGEVDACGVELTCDAEGSCGQDTGEPLDGCAVEVCTDEGVRLAATCSATSPATVSTVGDSFRFLFEGPNAPQQGVETNTIDPLRAGLISGRVIGPDGLPRGGIEVSIWQHEELGGTFSQSDGSFMLVANGGGTLVVDLKDPGYLPLQRHIDLDWGGYATFGDFVMTPLDPVVTTITPDAAEYQVADSSEHTDESGTRRARVAFPPNTRATMVLDDGVSIELEDIQVRATEYTVGNHGLDAMPGTLPLASGYTYAVELSVDEALVAGATRVDFDKALPFYVDNFLDLPTGLDVPSGYYDRGCASWIPSDNGRIIQVVGQFGDLAELDINGDGAPEEQSVLDAFGIPLAERRVLASLYPIDATFWRVPVRHFTPWDHNFPYGPPDDATDPPPDPPEPPDDDDDDDDECEGEGSIIELQKQVLRESIPVVGTDISLEYSSDRTFGYGAGRSLSIPVTGATVPASAKRAVVEIEVAGKKQILEFSTASNQSTLFTWDGLDLLGRPLYGAQKTSVRRGYVYDAVYQEAGDFSQSFGQFSGTPITGSRARRELTLWSETEHQLGRTKQVNDIAHGWGLSVQHFYDPSQRQVQLGSGREINAGSSADAVSEVSVGTGSPGRSEDGSPPRESALTSPGGVAMSAAGELYISDSENSRILKLGRDGQLTTVVGEVQQNLLVNPGCEECTASSIPGWTEVRGTNWRQGTSNPLPHSGARYFFAGGGPPSDAELAQDVNVSAFASSIDAGEQSFFFEGRVRAYLNQPDSSRIIVEYRNAAEEILSSFDSGPYADASRWVRIVDTRLAPIGTRKIRVRLLSQMYSTSNVDGYYDTLRLVPGDGGGGSAEAAYLSLPRGLVVAPNDSVYVADPGSERVVKISPDGSMVIVAGTGQAGFSGDNDSGYLAALNEPSDVALSAQGDLFITDTLNHRLRKVSACSGIITTVAGTGVAGSTGVDGPAAQARLNRPRGVAVGDDGTIYIAEEGGHRVSKIGSDGILRVVAGTGVAGVSPSGTPAITARLREPTDVFYSEGRLLISQKSHLVQMVNEDGTIGALIGTGVAGSPPEGTPAINAQINAPQSVIVGSDRAIYLSDTGNHVIRRIRATLPGLSVSDIVVPSRAGDEIYIFSGTGQHLSTRHARTGHTIWSFGYQDDLLASITGATGQITDIHRDDEGIPTAIEGPYGHTTSLNVDSDGNLVAVTNAAGEVHQMTYFAESLLATFENPRGGLSLMTYDELGFLQSDVDEWGASTTLVRTSEDSERSVVSTSSSGLSTTFDTTNGVDGSVASTTYFADDTQGTRSSTADGLTFSVARDGTQTTTQSSADPRWGLAAPDRATTVQLPSGLARSSSSSTAVVMTDPLDPLSLASETITTETAGLTTTQHYNAAERTFTTTTPENRVTLEQFDEISRLIELQSPGAPVLRTEYTLDKVTAVIIDPDGVAGSGDERQTTMEYDSSSGRLLRVIDPLTHQTLFGAYDGADRPGAITLPDASQVLMTYDQEGNVATVTPPGKSAHGMTYGPRGRIESYTPPVGNPVQFIYDQDRRMDLIDFGVDAFNQPNQVDFEYDSTTGQLSTITSPTGTINVGFENGHMTSLSAPSVSGSIVTSIAYDGFLPTALSWAGPVAGEVNWTYNDRFLIETETIGALPETTVQYSYDDDGLVTQAGDLAIARDPASGRVVSKTIGNIRESFEYNEFAELSRQTVELMNGSTVVETLYDVVYDDDGVNGDRDALGRITKKTEWIVSGDVPNGDGSPRDLDARTYDYGYNPEGRPWLESVAVDGAVVSSYGYDDNGNRTSVELNWSQLGYDASFDASLTEADTEYDEADKLLTYGTKSYTWNAFGQLSSMTDSATGETTAYEYDLFGNLLSVALPDGRTIEYEVDGAGRRVGRRELDVDGNEVSFRGWIYRDLLRPIAEVDALGNVVARYVYSDGDGSRQNGLGQVSTRLGANQDTSLGFSGSNVPEAIELLDAFGAVIQTLVLSTNQVGSVQLVADAETGDVVQRIEHDEFGRVVFDTAPGLQPFGFAGGVYDETTRLVRFGARDYSADAGRWIARDPIQFSGGDSDLYLYANSDPVNGSDSTGLFVDCIGALFDGMEESAKCTNDAIEQSKKPFDQCIAEGKFGTNDEIARCKTQNPKIKKAVSECRDAYMCYLVEFLIKVPCDFDGANGAAGQGPRRKR